MSQAIFDQMADRLSEFSDLAKRIEASISIQTDDQVIINLQSAVNQISTIAIKMGNNLLMFKNEEVKDASDSRKTK